MAYNYLLLLQSYLDEVKINWNRLRYTRVRQNAFRRRSMVNNLFSVTRQDRGREKNATHHRFSSDDKSTIVRTCFPNHLTYFLWWSCFLFSSKNLTPRQQDNKLFRKSWPWERAIVLISQPRANNFPVCLQGWFYMYSTLRHVSFSFVFD